MFIVTLAMMAAHSHATPIKLGAGKQPRVVADGSKVAVVYGSQADLWIANSTDGGKTFAHPSRVGGVEMLPLGMRRGPRVAMSDAGLVIAAIEKKEAVKGSGDVRAWTSADGKAWVAGPAPLNSVAGSAREGLHGIGANAKGVVACVWLDLRNVMPGRPGTEVWINTSKDGGKSWGKDTLVYRVLDGTVCECCHPSVAVAEDGTIHVLFRNALEGNRDMYLTSSRDGGQTFADAVKLGEGSWPLKGCPMDGGDLAVTAKGEVQTVWMRRDRVFSAVPGAMEVSVGAGRQPVVVATDKGLWQCWQEKDQLVARWGNAEPRPLAAKGKFASAARAADDGVAVVWEQDGAVWFELIPAPAASQRP